LVPGKSNSWTVSRFCWCVDELATLGVALLHKQITSATAATILIVVGIGSIAAATVLSFIALRRI